MSESIRLYAATTGRCVARTTPDVDEDERTRIQHDFHAGIRLVLDGKRGEIRGAVPVHRGAQELFFASVSGVGGDEAPFATYVAAVTELIAERSGWTIRWETPDGRLIDRLGSVSEPGEVSADEQPQTSSGEGDTERTTYTVSSMDEAADICQRLVAAGEVGPTAPATIIVATSNSVDHVDYDVLVYVRPEGDKTGASGAAQPDSEEESRPRASGLVRWLRNLFGG